MEIIHVIDVIGQIISIVSEKKRVAAVRAESSKVIIEPSLYYADVSTFNEV